MEPLNGHIVTWTLGYAKYFSDFWGAFFAAFYLASYMLSASNNIVLFIYRYFIIVRNHTLTKCQFCTFTLVVIIWNVIGMVLWFFAFLEVDEEDEIYVKETLDYRLFLDLDMTKIDFRILHIFSIEGMLSIMFSVITVCIVGVTVIYTMIGINKEMFRKKDIISTKTKQLNTQLNRLMLLNVTLSFAFNIIPVSIILLGGIMGKQMYGYGHFVFYTFQCQPFFNMIICILFVKPCREELIKLLLCKTNVSKSTATTNG
uniref:G_PROTEIN_RECEP_F1_2 domain-containing protein n=1 Tax=Parastrongyloides trichosuri TaxID=131310 RepID=A0A0N4Z8H9_PARTI